MRWVLGMVAVAFALALPAPAAASQSVTYQLNAAHTGATTEPGLDPPFTRRWAIDLGQPTSYPLIAGGRVFVVARNPSEYGTRLYALDARDGRIAWQRAIGGTYYWSGIAYDAGRVFTLDGDGLMMALDAATGAPAWSRQLPGQYSFSSEPAVAGGTVYAGGAGSGGTLYAVDAATGGVHWTRTVCCGSHSSPAIADGRVHVGYVCDTYGFAAVGGAPVWHHNEGCSGGGGRTTVAYGGRLYARDGSAGVIHDAATGAILGSFTSATAPAFAGDSAFLQAGGTLEAVNVPAFTTRWSFSDGQMSVAPIVVNGAVIAGSLTGNVYALDRATGRVLWQDAVGRPVGAPDEHNVSEPVTGLGAGEGLLVVPAGGLVVAYGACTGSCPAAPPPAGTPTAAQDGPRITLSVGKRRMYLGQRTRVRGRLIGVPDVSRRRIVLEADEFPFGGFRGVARARTDRLGRFAFVARPPRNVRLRARLGGTLYSRERTIYADFPWRVRPIDRGGRRPRLRYTVYAFRGAALRRKRVFAYLTRGRTEPWRLVTSRRWQRKGRRSVTTTLRYPRGRLGRGDRWMLCMREPTPDGYGISSEIERRCGAPEIPRGLS